MVWVSLLISVNKIQYKTTESEKKVTRLETLILMAIFSFVFVGIKKILEPSKHTRGKARILDERSKQGSWMSTLLWLKNDQKIKFHWPKVKRCENILYFNTVHTHLSQNAIELALWNAFKSNVNKYRHCRVFLQK